MEKHLLILYCCKSYPTTKRNRQMHTQYINEMLDLPELKIHQILLSFDTDELHIEALPLSDKHCCPCCQSDQQFIQKEAMTCRPFGIFAYLRRKPICTSRPFGCIVHAAKLVCLGVRFVGLKQCCSRLFRSQAVEQALGSTATHSARMQQALASRCRAGRRPI